MYLMTFWKRINTVIAAVCLCGCSTSKAVSVESSDDSERMTVKDLQNEDLKKPEYELKNLNDFIYALDYLSFYRVSDQIYFSFDKDYASTFKNPYTEYQKAYEQSDLADVYACVMDDSYYSEDGVISVKFSVSKDDATVKAEAPDTPFLRSYDDTENGDRNLVIPLDKSDKKEIHCETSEQLYYLAMNGYKPVPVKGSMAETIYKEAEKVLRERIREDMSDFEKIKAVYDYLTGEIYYDRNTAYSLDTYLVDEQAYYLEGVFLNHCAVCDGKAKAYALLMNMLGIPCYRDTGKSEDGDHAWNMVQLDGTWYISCSTYGQADMTDSINRIVPNYATLLTNKETPYGDEWGFVSQKHLDISSKISDEPYDVYKAMNENLIVNDMDDLKALLAKAKPSEDREYKVEFLYTGNDDSFQNQMVDYLSALENVNAVEVKSETGKAYEILCMKS